MSDGNDVMQEMARALGRRGGKPFLGESKAALRRRQKRNRGTIHTGRPGQIVEMCGGRVYLVAEDGSFRNLRKAA